MFNKEISYLGKAPLIIWSYWREKFLRDSTCSSGIKRLASSKLSSDISDKWSVSIDELKLIDNLNVKIRQWFAQCQTFPQDQFESSENVSQSEILYDQIKNGWLPMDGYR